MIMFSGWGTLIMIWWVGHIDHDLVGGTHTLIMLSGWDTYIDVQWVGHIHWWCSVGGTHTLVVFSGWGTYTLSRLTLTICSAITTIPMTKWAVPTGCSERDKCKLKHF